MPTTASRRHTGGAQFPLSSVCGALRLCGSLLGAAACGGNSLIALCVAAVLALELVNSAIERAVDKPDTTHWWSAGAAKDMAAGAVLVMAVGTLIVALCVFWPRLGTLWANFTLRPTRPAGLVLTLVIFCKFIFRSSNSTEKGKQPNGKTDS